MYIYVYVSVCGLCMPVEVRGQLEGTGSLSSYQVGTGDQIQVQQAPLPTKSSCKPL